MAIHRDRILECRNGALWIHAHFPANAHGPHGAWRGSIHLHPYLPLAAYRLRDGGEPTLRVGRAFDRCGARRDAVIDPGWVPGGVGWLAPGAHARRVFGVRASASALCHATGASAHRVRGITGQ